MKAEPAAPAGAGKPAGEFIRSPGGFRLFCFFSSAIHPSSLILLLAEGDDWLVVSKPAHLLVHPTRPGGPVTLLDHLRRLLAYECTCGGQVSLVHRLDRETSGVMLIAKTAAAARRFSLDMMRGRIGKEYLALVRGWPEWDATTVDAPLLRQGERQPSAIWLKRMIHPDGAPARTRFEVQRRGERPEDGARWSLVRAMPETGRLHQIRVHLAQGGHPVVGDKIYGPDEGCYLRFIETGWTPALARVLWLDRHALHAHRLTFDPGDGPRTVEAPLPDDMAGWLAGSAVPSPVVMAPEERPRPAIVRATPPVPPPVS